MDLLWFVILIVLFFKPARSAQNATTPPLPDCAQQCLSTAISNSTCSPTDQECVCSDTSLTGYFVRCATNDCTTRELLVSLNVTSMSCGDPIRDRRQEYYTVAVGFTIVSGIFIGLRLLQRLIFRSGFYMDDYIIALAFCITITTSSVNIYGMAANGLGRDVWTLSFDQITNFLRFLYVAALLYYIEVFLVKLAILAFYLRIFKMPGTLIRRLIWAAIVVAILGLISFVIAGIFGCRPIYFYWERWDNTKEGQCLDINGLMWSNAAISITLDFWMLGLPLWQLRQLQLHWKQKVGVGMMFSVGAFVTAVSIVRLQYLVLFGKTANPTCKIHPLFFLLASINLTKRETGDHFATVLWSTIEMKVAIWCACMPNLRLLVGSAFSSVLGSTVNPSQHSGSSIRLNSYTHHPPDSSAGILHSRSFEVEYGSHDASGPGRV
ncbi:related to integral membrane protein PTH11 [Phialocephala subalpina]|uniref:Related to integral membrane protein PTH11 n=1 Tax=Phialocephala subalpina TaxID=576137 RepID=A0A1L7XMT9_9HELO|nr:related to integral membrane protein PTH11 [Phialocephala subalpina]